LPTNLKTLIKYLSKPTSATESNILSININSEYIFDKTFYENIQNTFNNQKSILLAFPTEADLVFYQNHLKTIFDESNFVILNKKISTKNLNI